MFKYIRLNFFLYFTLIFISAFLGMEGNGQKKISEYKININQTIYSKDKFQNLTLYDKTGRGYADEAVEAYPLPVSSYLTYNLFSLLTYKKTLCTI